MHAQSDLRAKWSKACRAGLQAQRLGLAQVVQFLLFCAKIALETLSEGPEFSRGGMPPDPPSGRAAHAFSYMLCSTSRLTKGNMLPTALLVVHSYERLHHRGGYVMYPLWM